MSERTLQRASAALAVAGAAVAGYLLYVRETDGTLLCATGGCEFVQSSPYAEVLGAPLAGLGFVGLLALLALALARGEWARLGQATLALSAVLFSGYLMFVQLFVIDAICQWCVVTDILTTAIAALALLRLRYSVATPPAPAARARHGVERHSTRGRAAKRKRKPKRRSRTH
jgi:uncharacterized membrane protein